MGNASGRNMEESRQIRGQQALGLKEHGSPTISG
jgi:hypothetical protein